MKMIVEGTLGQLNLIKTRFRSLGVKFSFETEPVSHETFTGSQSETPNINLEKADDDPADEQSTETESEFNELDKISSDVIESAPEPEFVETKKKPGRPKKA